MKHIKLFWYGWILGDTLDGRNLPPGFIYSARLPSTKGAPSRIFTQVKLTHIYIHYIYIQNMYIHYICIFDISICRKIYMIYHWVYIGHFIYPAMYQQCLHDFHTFISGARTQGAPRGRGTSFFLQYTMPWRELEISPV